MSFREKPWHIYPGEVLTLMDYYERFWLIININMSPCINIVWQRVITELCCTSCDTHSQKGTYNTSFVPAALASCTFQIIKQDPVSYVQRTVME